jgi:hypothetical protein
VSKGSATTKGGPSGRRALAAVITGGLVLLGGSALVRKSIIGDDNVQDSNDVIKDVKDSTIVKGSTVNSNNSTSTTTNNTTAYTNNTVINLIDGFAVRGEVPINLSPPDIQISPSGNIASRKPLSEEEMQKIGRSDYFNTGNSRSFVNGYISIALLAAAQDEKTGIDYATVTVEGLKPETFKVKTGWSQAFLTPYGRFRLRVERISSAGQIEVAVYDMN